MQPLDPDHVVGVCQRGIEVTPVEHARPDGVRPGFLVQHHFVFEGFLAVEDVWQRVVLDLDELGGVARELTRTCHHGRDGIADMAHTPDRERIVLDVRSGRRGELEEGVREDRDFVTGERSVDAVQLERLRDVDGLDPCVRVRRPHELDVAHLVPLDVVEEHALALDEALVLLPRDVLSDEARLELA